MGDAGIFERVPGTLEQQALLRVHALGFARRDAEVFGVETIDVAQEAAPLAVALADAPAVGELVDLEPGEARVASHDVPRDAVDVDAVAKAVAALLPESTVDVDAIAKAVRAAIIKE